MIRVVEVLSSAVREVIQEGRSLDQVTSFWLKQNKDWDPEEKSFFAETLPEVIRWWRLLNELKFATTVNHGSPFADAVINYIALHNESHSIERVYNSGYQKKIQAAFKNLNTNRALQQSIPDWMDEFGFQELGKNWEIELKALNKTPEIILRVNRLKGSREELLKWLKRERFKAAPLDLPDAIHITERTNIYKSEAFTLGLFEQQDYSSQQVAPFMEVKPGMRVIDACAGNGGKTLHIASLMENKGRIIAMDNIDWKLTELRHRVKRSGASIVEAKLIESSKTIKRLKDSADRLLLDVPCSGLGVLRRNPDSKWKLTAERIDELRKIQADILSRYWVMVKPQGKIVYSTCSILPSENERQVQQFIEKFNGQFVLEEERKISPAKSGYDGFYMARIRREF